MRRTFLVLAACAALTALAAQPAAAQLVDRGAARCDTDATWVITDDNAGTYFAEWSYDTGSATGTGCKHLRVLLYDDTDFDVEQRDFAQVDSGRFRLFVATGPGESVFAGTHHGIDGAGVGPFAIAAGLLNATTVVVSPDGHRAVIEHRGLGTCGTRCFRTRSTWVATNQ